jgi:hypothetical protein
MGQAVGTAAAGCIRYGVMPREYGKKYIEELRCTLHRDDQFIPGYVGRDSSNLALGASAVATSEEVGNPASKVLDGGIRTLPDDNGEIDKIVEDTGYGYVNHQPKGESRQWVSDPRCELPQSITVRLAKVREASEIRVVFDSDFYLPSKWVHHRVPSTLARSYKVETSQDGTAWEEVADVKVNKRRLAVHRFATRKVRDVRVTVTETYGDPSVRIFEIGVW